MKEKVIVIILLVFCCCTQIQAQEISLDTTGRLYDLRLTRPKGNITVKINSELNADKQQNRIREFFLEKITATLVNLDDPDQLYKKYYSQLWTADTRLKDIKTELVAIKKWLEDDTSPGTITRLSSFYNGLKTLRGANVKDWYKVNGNDLGTSVTVLKSAADRSTGAYVIELRQNNLFNKFVTELYTNTWPLASNNNMKELSASDYLRQEQELKTLLNRIEAVLKKDVNDMAQTDSIEMAGVSTAVDTNRIIMAMRSSADYFTNWIWLRTGELTINPFEKKGKDTLTGAPGKQPLPRSRNQSLLKEATLTDELLNRILLSHDKKRTYRNIHYFRLEGSTIRQNKQALDEPVRGDEVIKVNMHNTRINERLELTLTDTVRHNGLNDAMNNIGSGISLLANTYATFSGVSALLGTALNTATIKKANKDRGNYHRVDVMNDSVTVLKTVLDSLKADFKDSLQFNQYIFDLTTVNPAMTALVSNDRILPGKMDEYLNKFVIQYALIYDKYVLLKESIGQDSLLVAVTYNNIYESSLPPASVSLQKSSDKPVYRTGILEAEKLNDDLKAKYLVSAFATNGAKTDTLKLATFGTKNAKLKWMVASAGLVFTVPDQTYAVNTFEGSASTAASISTKRKTTSFVAGLNIYAKPVNMLDNHWFASKNCPWYSRVSLFIGLDIPDVKDHFYPGLSYDILPGLKITGGAHLYRHTKFEIRNNEMQKKGDVLRGAGPFIGLSIDPTIALKVINIFN